MHFLTRQNLHIARFHPLMKVLLTLYIVSVLAALVVAALKYTDRAQWSAEGLERFVAGSGPAAIDDPFGDPFSGTAEGLAVDPAMSRRELVDIVHPHLFSVPIVIFVLGHLLHLTGLRDRWKLVINVTAFVSFLATFLLPFAVVGSPGLSTLMYVSGCAMLLSFVALCVIPLGSMWYGKPGRGFDALPRRPAPDPHRHP